MAKTYPIAVSDGKYKASYYALVLRSYGLSHENSEFIGNVTKFKMRKIEAFCRRKHLRFRINNSYGKRSSNYRDLFFESCNPIFGNCWFCAYCGKPLSASKVTVDHLFPVGQAKRSLRVQREMQMFGIYDVNDIKNLVPACKKCNQRKGQKMGFWILRGFVGGRCQYFWYFGWFVRFVVLLLLICVIIVSMKG